MNNPSNYYSCNSNGGAVMSNTTAATALGNANQQRINSNDQFQQQHQQQQQHQHLQQQQQLIHLSQQQSSQQHNVMMHLQHQQQHQHQQQQLHLQQQSHVQQHNMQQQQQLMQQNRLYSPYHVGEMQTYDRSIYEVTSTPAPYHHQHHHHRLVSLDGIQSGVPTLTTSTLTPTTLRNIEQTFIELTADPPNPPPYAAGFVPPRAPFNLPEFHNETNSMPSSEDSQNSWHTTPIPNEENSMATTDTSSVATTNNDSPSYHSNGTGGGGSNAASTSNAVNDFSGALARVAAGGVGKNSSTSGSATQTPSRRNHGGRRPTKATNMSPEEEEKRKIRRERNKLAAARCRKRRVDQTNELLDEVAVLEKRRESLKKEMLNLHDSKEQLQKIIEEHRSQCNKLRPNNNNILMDTYNSCDTGRGSPLDLKPVNLPAFDLKCIKSEPNDQFDDGPPSPKRILLSQSSSAMVPPLPNVSTISASIPQVSALNTPTITNSPPPMLKPGGPAKQRPSSLNVPLQMMPGMGKTVTDINGVAITTPSSGVMFNFDSLMDGGTGLTPVSGPLIPTCSSQNKHPLEMSTPTSEPSKLVSL